MKHALRFCLLLLAIAPFVMCVVGELGLLWRGARQAQFIAVDPVVAARIFPGAILVHELPENARFPVAMGPPIADKYGDSLPIGACIRLGTERFRVHGGGFAQSPNGKILALGRRNHVHLCSSPSGEPLRDLGKLDSPRVLCFSPDNELLAVVAKGGISLFQASRGKRLFRLTWRKYKISQSAFTPDGNQFVAAGFHNVYVWELATGKLLRKFRVEANAPKYPFRLSADGRVLAELVSTRAFRIWDTVSGKLLGAINNVENSIDWLAISPKGRCLVTIDTIGKTIHLWDVATGRGKQISGDPIYHSLSFSPCGTTFAAVHAEDPKSLYIWERNSGELLRVIRGKHKIDASALAPGGRAAAVVRNGQIHVVKISTEESLARLSGHVGLIHRIQFTPDGKQIAAQDAATVRIWNVESGEEITIGPGHYDLVKLFAIPSRGNLVATAGNGHTVQVWDTVTGQQLRCFPADSASVNEIAISSDGKTLASFGDADWRVRVWDLASGELRREFKQTPIPSINRRRHRGVMLALSHNGKSLAVTSNLSQKVSVHSLATGKINKLELHATDMAFSPDGAWFAVIGGGSTHLWRIVGNDLRFCGRLAGGGTLAFSPDGKFVATYDLSAVYIWELITRQRVFPFSERVENSESLRITKNGNVLAFERRDTLSNLSQIYVSDVLTKSKIQRILVPRHSFSWSELSPDGTRLFTGSKSTIVGWKIASVERTGLEVEMDSGHLEQLWQDLGGRNATRAFEAARRLRAAKEVTVAFLKQRLHPVPVERHPSLIADLGSRNFAVRQKAIKAFWQLGRTAGPALRAALQTNLTLEVHLRVHDLLEKIEKLPPTSDFLRHYRGITVLEQIGGDSAREHLATLAAGASEASLTKEAAASIRRLDERE